MEPIVIVASCASYRTGDFIDAAATMRLPVVIATDAPSPFDSKADRSILVDLEDAEGGGTAIADAVPTAIGVIAIDDQGVRVAAEAASRLGLPTNPQTAVAATRDKLAMRTILEVAGVPQPRFTRVDQGGLRAAAATIGLPIVVKPTGLSASRGVIRVDRETDLVSVEQRVRRIVADAGQPWDEPLIAESYVEGSEMVVEGLMSDGSLEVLALIDKPVPLVGPFFEETMFISPSLASADVSSAVIDTVSRAADAIGLVTGPVHAEVRVDGAGRVFVIEIAARSIGGLCGRSLSFGLLAEPLESVIIRSAIGRTSKDISPAKPATGVLMLPIPGRGTLTGIDGVDDALALEGIDDVEITIPIGREVVPLPEGDRYLGFVFASGLTAAAVQSSLAAAASIIEPLVDGESVASDGQIDAGSPI